MDKAVPVKRLLNYSNLFWISLVHLVSLAAIFYWSWSNFFAMLLGVFFLGPLGINVGYHRLFAHRAFVSPRWLRYALATLGSMLGAGPPIHWAAMHRVHHRYSDTPLDPHNASRGFWYSHILHLFVVDSHEADENHLQKYAPDLVADPYLAWLNRYWLWFALATLPLLYLVGGVGMVLWAGFVRLAVTWHIMWFVNSASHLWGYRNYKTNDLTRNCWWVGFLAGGEGWHNNHHAFPNCAAHGHKWWEFDFSYQMIRGLEWLKVISGVRHAAKSQS